MINSTNVRNYNRPFKDIPTEWERYGKEMSEYSNFYPVENLQPIYQQANYPGLNYIQNPYAAYPNNGPPYYHHPSQQYYQNIPPQTFYPQQFDQNQQYQNHQYQQQNQTYWPQYNQQYNTNPVQYQDYSHNYQGLLHFNHFSAASAL